MTSAEETLSHANVEKRVMEIAATTLGRKNVTPDEPLFATTKGFDSIGLMEFILQLEEEFDVSIPDEDLDPDVFYNVNSIVTFLLEKLN